MEMKYCMTCGTKLEMRYLASEGKEIPYCPQCEDFCFPVFNTAVSMIVTTRQEEELLLIKQYGRDAYILTAGYINKGEDAEHAVKREIKEELGVDVIETRFNHSHYFSQSNTLMLNFTAIIDQTHIHENEEIDEYAWFTKEEARKNILPDSLAQAFLKGYLTGSYEFKKEKNAR